ncbi:hypothetical protein AB9P05_06320 [Roseivirga sp. BDSF3-8]|uniref:hypothetical protein n=1 Tax=Roseivirga sp. BDSF3-8 TaxID=3241598 RepID=UPI0035325CFB
MKALNIIKFSLILASPLTLFSCAGDQYARQSSDDLYFSRSDRKVYDQYEEEYASSSVGYSEDYAANRETDLDYGDEEYTARDVNPEYIAKYRKQGEDNLRQEEQASDEDIYFEEEYDQQNTTYSNYTGGNAYSQPNNWRNNGAWQNNPYYAGYNRYPGWNPSFNSGWNFGMHSGWGPYGSNFGWSIGYNWGNPYGFNDPWMNPYYSRFGWNDPWMNPYRGRWGGWGYDPFFNSYYPVAYRPYYPTRQVVIVRPSEPGLSGNVRRVDGYRGSRSNTMGVSKENTRTNRRINPEPSSVDNSNENRIVTPDRYQYSRERGEESPRSRSRSSEMNRSNNRSNRAVSPNNNSNRSNTYQRSRNNRSNSGTYQRRRSNSNSSGGGSGTYQRSRNRSSSGGGGGSTFSSPNRSSSGSGSYTPSRSRSSSGSSGSSGGSRSRSRRGGGGGE